MGAASRMSRSAAGSYMSISIQRRSNGSSARASLMQASGRKRKFRSRQMSTRGPTASRSVPIRRTAVSSVAWSRLASPCVQKFVGVPGAKMLVLSAV